jgi:hypothetical protein
MPKKTYKRKRRSISKRSRGMKRYKKTRTRGGVNELYNDNNYINPKPMINSQKNYGFMYKKPNTIINNDKFNYYSSPSNDINNKIINTSYKELYKKP